MLTAWNGIAIRGMAKAGLVLERTEVDRIGHARGRLHREEDVRRSPAVRDLAQRSARHPAYLDDYANLLDGLLALLQVRWRDADARVAKSLADTVVARFYDNDGGGFYFTANDHEQLIHRPKPSVDDAMPPGNGVLARALNLLGHLLGEARYLEAASGTLNWARAAMEQYPAGHSTLLAALEDELNPPELIIVRGPRAELESWLRPVRTGFRPWRHAFGIPYEEVGRDAGLPAAARFGGKAATVHGVRLSRPVVLVADSLASGTRSRAQDGEHLTMPLRIIGAGFGRTGTLSLKLALEQLGFGPCYHMVEVFKNPLASQWWVDAADGNPDWDKIFDGYNACVDWPAATFYATLADTFPDAKVILTERDPEAWFRSTQATIFPLATPPDTDAPFDQLFRKIVGRLFDNRMRDHDHVIEVFKRHNAEVRRRIAPNRLLVYELDQGWEPLVPVPRRRDSRRPDAEDEYDRRVRQAFRPRKTRTDSRLTRTSRASARAGRRFRAQCRRVHCD